MNNHSKSMKDVVIDLRRESVGALVELYDLDVAVGEITRSAHSLYAALRELADETKRLADKPDLALSPRLQALAAFAVNASSKAECQAAALVELRQGLATWSIAG